MKLFFSLLAIALPLTASAQIHRKSDTTNVYMTMSLNCEPIELGAIDICGMVRVKASAKVDIPCSLISFAVITCTGVTAVPKR